ncbi:M20/M25/M40 family metallo-hydrolase [bacterium]|nr:M20/M25/M40 family metallo-hydrolase [bacterium]
MRPHNGWCLAAAMAAFCFTGFPLFAESPTVTESAVRVFVPQIVAADVRPHIEYLAGDDLHGRSGADAKIAAAYLVDHFRQHELKPLFGDRYDQLIPGLGHTTENPIFVGRNIGGWIEGSDPELKKEFVVIGVHYDHLGERDGEVFAGADDNASGVAMMLELAEQIAKQPTKPKRSVVFIGFDLEEHMLWGSRWFAAHPPWPLEQVKLFITADMISRSLGDLPLPAVFVLGSEHAPQLKRCLDEVGHPEGLEIARLGIDLVGTRSDYGPFRDREVPFLFFSTGEHPDYHTPRDRPERADFDKAARVSSLVLEIVTCVANTNDPPVWSQAVTGDLDEPKALERITTLLLEADDNGRLTDIQRYMVSTVRGRCRKILAAGQMTADDRVWLVRMAQLLLLSVF